MVKKNKTYKNILILPDMHAPWIDIKAIQLAHKWAEKHNPELVIQLGDLTDQKIWSRWQADVDDYSPSQEFEKAEKILEKIHSYFPDMTIIRGNHDNRIKNRAIEAGIPGRMFSDVNEIFNYDGWNWIKRNDRCIVKTARGPVLFMHGDEMGGNAAQKSRILGMNYIQGHTHKASITYTQTPNGHFFGAEMGHLMDVQSKAARYSQANPVGSSLGFGVMKFGVPYFIPYFKGVRV